VSKLSGGQRKRLSLGVELLGDPDVLFADEPTSGLDPALERSLTELFRKMADNGRTVVVTTHIMSSLSLFDRLAVLVAGRLVYFGPPDTIKSFFQVEDLADIYGLLTEGSAKEWRKRFADSELHKRYLGS
jgi:ABC-type multidrug transport system ATPase subunit